MSPRTTSTRRSRRPRNRCSWVALSCPGEMRRGSSPHFSGVRFKVLERRAVGLEILVLERGEKSEMFGFPESERAQPAVKRGGDRPSVVDRGAPLGSVADLASIGASNGSAGRPAVR